LRNISVISVIYNSVKLCTELRILLLSFFLWIIYSFSTVFDYFFLNLSWSLPFCCLHQRCTLIPSVCLPVCLSVSKLLKTTRPNRIFMIILILKYVNESLDKEDTIKSWKSPAYTGPGYDVFPECGSHLWKNYLNFGACRK